MKYVRKKKKLLETSLLYNSLRDLLKIYRRVHLASNHPRFHERIKVGLPIQYMAPAVPQSNVIDFIYRNDRKVVNGYRKYNKHFKLNNRYLECYFRDMLHSIAIRRKLRSQYEKVFEVLFHELEMENFNTTYEDFEEYEYLYFSIASPRQKEWTHRIFINAAGFISVDNVDMPKAKNVMVETMEKDMATFNTYRRYPKGTFLKVINKDSFKSLMEENGLSFEGMHKVDHFVFGKNEVKAAISKALN